MSFTRISGLDSQTSASGLRRWLSLAARCAARLDRGQAGYSAQGLFPDRYEGPSRSYRAAAGGFREIGFGGASVRADGGLEHVAGGADLLRQGMGSIVEMVAQVVMMALALVRNLLKGGSATAAPSKKLSATTDAGQPVDEASESVVAQAPTEAPTTTSTPTVAQDAPAADSRSYLGKTTGIDFTREIESLRRNGQILEGENYCYVLTGVLDRIPIDEYIEQLEKSALSANGTPLILDIDRDGEVSARAGRGVDIDGDGRADGAATGGDRMLAMGDLDGDGKITGKEVFGNYTIDPFTGRRLGAANGFEALAMVAKSAWRHTGISCIDERGEVDLRKLKQALERSGKGSLGLISGDNVSELESLGDVAAIDTHGYVEQQQSGAVQHNQIGSYRDTAGDEHRVDDVWFRS